MGAYLGLALYQALPLSQLFWFVGKDGESLVHFDHMLDVVGRGLKFAVDFAHIQCT